MLEQSQAPYTAQTEAYAAFKAANEADGSKGKFIERDNFFTNKWNVGQSSGAV